MRKLIVLGANGFAVDVAEAASLASEPFTGVGFLDDDATRHGQLVNGLPVLGGLARARDFPDCFLVNAIGADTNFWKRPEIIAKTGAGIERFATTVHPRAVVSPSARLGRGAVVMANSTICANARLGDHTAVLAGSVINHDASLGDYCCVAGGVVVSGSCCIGPRCYLGANCSLKQRVAVGQDSLVGMGATVVSDVSERSVVVGTPARFVRHTF